MQAAVQRGMILGATIPLVYGLWLIVTAIEWNPAERTIPSCGTGAMAGIIVLGLFVPTGAAVGAACVCGWTRLTDLILRLRR